SLLRKFVAGQATVVDQIRQAMADGDRPVARRLAHTLKGVAGNIGATTLQAQASTLEQTLKANSPDWETAIATLAATLIPLIEALAHQLPPEERVSPAPLEASKVYQLCQRLIHLLTEDDAEAIDLWQDHRSALRHAFPEQYAPIEAALNAFNFDAALETLTAATDKGI
ncbi:MAG: Hpt domain-containing protein, partial [Synechocystis sp.]|nr:Hpt domain-containing protein [Synechocystis sp.]